ncbi:MAG: amidohydrolase family protein [Gemmatimonadetes bacterium]|nr:amidohydrolase family protein [Gemmatimonadota bacterium]MDE3256377.1 amidohydrolase family protein [Gemmatimonadota bacterium]
MTTSADMYDLLITAGRVFCADTGLDGPGAVAARGDRIVAAGPDVKGTAGLNLDYPDALLLPGLVDMHAHPARGGSRFGVDPDTHFLPRGVTTCLSQGDAGALNWQAYRQEVVHGCRTRVRLALHLSKTGESPPDHCFEHVENADVDLCVDTIAEAGEDIWGIAFNTVLEPRLAHDPREIMRRGVEAAERSGRPILYGPRFNIDFPLEEQLRFLRAGDLFTYTFSPRPDNIIAGGRVRRAVRDARDRGVLFDGCHGMQSFSFPHAEQAIAEGFYPDTISTDQYNAHAGADPPHHLPRTMSKYIAAGMPEAEVFPRATARPAELLGLKGEAGTLAPGACADIAVLRWNPDGRLADVLGVERHAGSWEPLATVKSGELVDQDCPN